MFVIGRVRDAFTGGRPVVEKETFEHVVVVLDLRQLTVHIDDAEDNLVLVIMDDYTTVLLDPGASETSPEAVAGAERCADQALMLAAALRTRAGR